MLLVKDSKMSSSYMSLLIQVICWGIVKGAVITHGVTGFVGDTVHLICPAGKTIRPVDARYACDILDNQGTINYDLGIGCDPFLQDGTYNPATTMDAKSLLAPTRGKRTATIEIPPISLCDGKAMCTNVMMIGTYDCV